MSKLIQPALDFQLKAESVVLWHGQVEFEYGNNEHSCNSFLHLIRQPMPKLLLKIPNINTEVIEFGISEMPIYIEGSVFEGNPSNTHFSFTDDAADDNSTIEIDWTPKNELITLSEENPNLTRIQFYLFNFLHFRGGENALSKMGFNANLRREEERRIENILLDSDEWQVTIQSHYSSREAFDSLKSYGGSQMTHIGEIKKKNDENFNIAEAKEFMSILKSFLSFCRGDNCELVCPIGFDSNDNISWRKFSSPRTGHKQNFSWCGRLNPDKIAELFPLFVKAYKDGWGEIIDRALYWYLQSNQAAHYSTINVDTGIILSQAGLEALSYEYSVNKKKLITHQGFNKLRASDQIRLIISSLNIPQDIPPSCIKLGKLIESEKWGSLPHAITEARNALVHPKSMAPLGRAAYEIWQLAQWCIELSILGICKYSGTYMNRVTAKWIGDEEQVPWKIN